jgi:hypothetical protein
MTEFVEASWQMEENSSAALNTIENEKTQPDKCLRNITAYLIVTNTTESVMNEIHQNVYLTGKDKKISESNN